MTVEHRSDNRNSTLQTLSRGLDLLQVLADAGGELGVRELARSMELGPPMVQRLLNTLAAHGFVEQNRHTRKYAVGHRAFMIGKSYVTSSSVVEAAMPVLRGLVAESDLNAYVGEIRGDYALYLLVLQSRGPVAVRATPGQRAALHTTAMGKALLAEMDRDAVMRLIGPGPLDARTPRSITDLSALLDELDTIRSTGLAISDEENLPGVYAVGAALRDADGHVTASVSLACPAAMANADARVGIGAQVREAAAQISRRMGAGL